MQKIRYIAGKVAFYILMPLWILLSLVWWKDDSLFILRHVYFMFTGRDEI